MHDPALTCTILPSGRPIAMHRTAPDHDGAHGPVLVKRRRVCITRTVSRPITYFGLGMAAAVACATHPPNPTSSTPPNTTARPAPSLHPAQPGGPRATRSAEPAPPAPPPPEGAFDSLTVPGHDPAVVWVPPVDSGRRPLLVVAHGAGGSPDWHCDFWSRIVGPRGFILCLRGRRTHYGVPLGQGGHYFPNHHYLRRVLSASLDAIVQRHPSELDENRAVFVGFSQGAIMGALVIAQQPARFPRALFIEGGGGEWDVPVSRSYFAGGGQRVGFACGVGACDQLARRGVRHLTTAGVAARRVYVAGAGHTYCGELEPDVRSLFEWVVEGDPRGH